MKYYLLQCTFPRVKDSKPNDIKHQGIYSRAHQMLVTQNEARMIDKFQSTGGLNNEKWSIDVMSFERIDYEDYIKFREFINGPSTRVIQDYIQAYLETGKTPGDFYKERMGYGVIEGHPSQEQEDEGEEYYLIDVLYNTTPDEARDCWFQMMVNGEEAEILVNRLNRLLVTERCDHSKEFEGVSYVSLCEVSEEDYYNWNDKLGRYEDKFCKEVVEAIGKAKERELRLVEDGKRPREETWGWKRGGQNGGMTVENEGDYDDEKARIKKRVKQV